MRIFVGGLWGKVGWHDLEQLVAEALKGPWYKFHAPRGQMVDCKLFQMTDLDGGEMEFSAVIEVEPSRLGWEVVQHLEGMYMNGSLLTAHKWFPRNGMNDRRVTSLESEEGAQQHDRRDIVRNDRRRHLSVQPLGRSMVRAVQGFERSYGS